MKRNQLILTVLATLLTLSLHAQQVNTLYFLENAPMRHTLNPALQPVSNGFINFTPLGWMSISAGNNSFTLSDVLYYDKQTQQTVTVLHPDIDRQQFLRSLHSMTHISADATLGLLNMGFRIKENGYLTIGINERISGGATLPKSIFNFVLGGGMQDLNGGVNTLALTGIGLGTSIYTEIGGGYSHRINEHWTVGGKLKVLLGQAYVGLNSKDFAINASPEQWEFKGTFSLDVAGPIQYNALPDPDGKRVNDYMQEIKDAGIQLNDVINFRDIRSMLTPSGYGAAIDLGFTYKPIENIQISAAVTDLGFIYWNKSRRYNCVVDTVFVGAGQIDYGDPAYRDQDGNFSTTIVMDTVKNRLMGLINGMTLEKDRNNPVKMVSTRLNIGLDANFWDNRIGIGILSATRLYNARLYEEITLGFAFRPVNWFNIAATYSLMNNGKYSNIGAGLGFMPYDGINLTLALDYIPTSYAKLPKSNNLYVIPDKTKMVNVALGFSICWGSNRRDKDKDGVWDKIDMCPDTPKGVKVDSVGCPLDEDHDGVPDYLDHCLGTPAAAIGFVDENGCMLDSDGDGVEDYKDSCPNTPREAWGKVDSVGCPLDSDGDGVADYLDECPETPKEAYGHINAKGCPLDSDGDGVPDYLDECPGTPEAAYGLVDEKGCPIDSDNDGVPDYKDECPNTPKKAIGYVDAKGCELDTDGDGIYDYEDACPTVPGIKANKGCPEIKREVRQLLQKAMQGIEFETGKATIKPKSFDLLNKIADTFIENSNYIIEVQGHTDNVGKPEMNQKLSEKRAQAVMQYLIGKGVPAERMSANGYGMDQPIADNKTAAGRQKNRRVEFRISFEEIHYETILDHADPEETVEE